MEDGRHDMTWGEGDVWEVRLQCYDERLDTEIETECKGAACGYEDEYGDGSEAYVGVIVS